MVQVEVDRFAAMLQLLIACQWTFALSAYEIKRSMPHSYVRRNGLPFRQDEAYGRMYYEHVTKSNRQSSRETPTVETSVSTLSCRAVEKNCPMVSISVSKLGRALRNSKHWTAPFSSGTVQLIYWIKIRMAHS